MPIDNSKKAARLYKILITALIVGVALLVRIQYVTRTEVLRPIKSDAQKYCIYSQNMIFHHVFSKEVSQNPTPDSFWAPGYPTLLAAILYSSGFRNFYPAVLFTQALLGALTAGMVFIMGLYFLPVWASAAAAILTTFSPHLISLSGYILTETLFTFTLVLFLLMYCIAIKTKRRLHAISAGFCAGLAYLANPVIFFAPFLFSLLIFLPQKYAGPSSRLLGKKLIALFLIAFMIPVLLWSLRCSLNVPATSASSSNRALINLIIGSHYDFYKVWRANPRNPANPAYVDMRKVKGSWSTFLPLLASRITKNPTHYAFWYFLEKPRLLWSWNMLVGIGDVYIYPVRTTWFYTSGFASTIHTIMKSIHWWLFLASLSGVFFVQRYRPAPSDHIVKIIYLCVIYVSAVYVVLQSEPRYSIPLRPIMYLCAVFGLWQITCAIKQLLSNRV